MLRALADWECPVKMLTSRRANGSKFALMHIKMVLCDETLMACGSMNATHNSATFCEELMFITREVPVVRRAVAEFWTMWDLAEVVPRSLYVRDELRTVGGGDGTVRLSPSGPLAIPNDGTR